MERFIGIGNPLLLLFLSPILDLPTKKVGKGLCGIIIQENHLIGI